LALTRALGIFGVADRARLLAVAVAKPSGREQARPIRPAARRMASRRRTTINTDLEDGIIITPVANGAAMDLPVAEAVGWGTRWPWRAGDGAARQAVAGRLGLEKVVPPDTELLQGKARAR
jgi:hypothetical protein